MYDSLEFQKRVAKEEFASADTLQNVSQEKFCQLKSSLEELRKYDNDKDYDVMIKLLDKILYRMDGLNHSLIETLESYFKD